MPTTTESLAELLATLVDIPSVTGDERAIADYVTKRLARAAKGEVLRSGNGLVWRGPQRGKPLIVLAGHLDTVPPSGNEKSRRDGDKLYGVGTTDMKAGDAVMHALHDSLDMAALRFDLAFVFYDADHAAEAVAEFWSLVVDLLEPDCTLVFDDADWDEQSTLRDLAAGAKFEMITEEPFVQHPADKHHADTYTLEIMRRP